MLKAYSIKAGGDPSFDEAVLIYAETEGAAIERGRHLIHGGLGMDECVAERQVQHDARAVGLTKTTVEEDDAYLRGMGWRLEDDETCDSCGLASFGIVAFEVCSDCNLCAECGCDDDCGKLDKP